MTSQVREDLDLVEWVALFASRNEMAVGYAGILRMGGTGWSRWSDLNAVIIERWSPSGLEYIKRRAWKLAAGAS